MNSILTIRPYRDGQTWVFDDPAVDLVREPFVSGIPEMIDILVRDIPDAPRGFELLFSADPFPGASARVDWLREESQGNWYKWAQHNMEGWLCPALFKYFQKAPPHLYMQAKPLAAVTKSEIRVSRTQIEALLALLDAGHIDAAREAVRAVLK